MHIQFLGATKTVTGSKYLLKADQTQILVDCGLFQGYKQLRLRNWADLPVNPRNIDYVLLTHAHIDHSGYIPLLVKNGFRGKILCTEATLDLCEILLPDSGYLHEEEARYAMRKGYSKHHPPLPLYTREEAEKSLAYFKPIKVNELIYLSKNLSCSYYYAGHILGASLIQVKHFETSILFSGDLGRPHDQIMKPPVIPPKTDYMVIESTYGNRLHENTSPEVILEEIINRTVQRQGIVLIPSFAVGRAQKILYLIHQLKSKKSIPNIPVYIDSPMATDATKLFLKHYKQHHLTEKQSKQVCKTADYIHSVEESKALHETTEPIIIISASGMATGGRILHHIKKFAPDKRNSIIFCGYQAGGTRGDRILRGEKEIKMFGEMIPINAEVAQLENTSAHVDYADMLKWLNKSPQAPRKIFITHGEIHAAQALKEKITEQFHWDCCIPEYLDVVELN